MKKKHAIMAGSLFLAILLAAAFLYGYGRGRSLREICFLDSKEVLTGAALYRNSAQAGESEHITLTKEEFCSLLEQMETVTYKKIGTGNGMGQDENYAVLDYTVDQRKIEIMFSSTDGGRILVNVVGENGKAPLYQMIPSGKAIQETILEFFHVPAQ